MNTHFKIISGRTVILGLLLLALLSSCKKYLYLKPEDSTYDKVFWATGANVEKALAGASGLFRDAITASRLHFIVGDFVTSEFLRGGDFWNFESLSITGQNNYAYTPYIDPVSNWTSFYGVINQCHLIVENTPNIDASKFEGGTEQKNQLLGEGYFLRALTYFYMLRIWGEPVVTKHSIVDPLNVPPVPRSTDEETLNYCIEDLLKAADLLQDKSDNPVYADKNAAWALLAHIYAWKHDYVNAKKYCDEVINKGGYSLEPIDTYTNIWNAQSDETIFEVFLKYDKGNNEAQKDFFNIFLFNPVVNKGTASSWAINTEYADALFADENDQRYTKIFKSGQGGTMLSKYTGVNYYDPNRPDEYVIDNNLVLFRLADIKLLKAEACVKLNALAEARKEINDIRDRAAAEPLADNAPCTIETVFDERARELYGEGSQAFDNIRMRLTNPDYADALPDPFTSARVAAKGYYWPLAMRVLLPQNALLTQNEWWKNH